MIIRLSSRVLDNSIAVTMSHSLFMRTWINHTDRVMSMASQRPSGTRSGFVRIHAGVIAFGCKNSNVWNNVVLVPRTVFDIPSPDTKTDVLCYCGPCYCSKPIALIVFLQRAPRNTTTRTQKRSKFCFLEATRSQCLIWKLFWQKKVFTFFSLPLTANPTVVVPFHYSALIKKT